MPSGPFVTARKRRDDDVAFFGRFVLWLTRDGARAASRPLPTWLEQAGLRVIHEATMESLIEDELSKKHELRLPARHFVRLRPLRNATVLPFLSFSVDLARTLPEIRLYVVLIALTGDGEAHQGIGMRFETPEGAGAEGAGRHHYFHCQWVRGLKWPSEDEWPIPGCPLWLPDTDPALPILASSTPTLLLAAFQSLYGLERLDKEIREASRKLFFSLQPGVLNLVRGPKERVFSAKGANGQPAAFRTYDFDPFSSPAQQWTAAEVQAAVAGRGFKDVKDITGANPGGGPQVTDLRIVD